MKSLPRPNITENSGDSHYRLKYCFNSVLFLVSMSARVV